jgi:hypothetical protein
LNLREQKVAAQKHTLDAQLEKLVQADVITSQQQDVSARNICNSAYNTAA